MKIDTNSDTIQDINADADRVDGDARLVVADAFEVDGDTRSVGT